MRQVTPNLPPALHRHFGSSDIAKADAFPVRNYRELVTHVAHLAHENPDHLLFYRGQSGDYRNKAGASTLYPSIYRADPLPKYEVESRFARLRFLGLQLAHAFKRKGLPGSDQLGAREVLQWSIIQHYEIGLTPLLDVTHSLAVACSFAQDGASGKHGYVYVLGLPHLANRISINSEHDIINIRLLSICPPDALRPYFQEGYLVGTWDVTHNYDDKNGLDFNRRLMAKFAIPSDNTFWGTDFGRVPRELLYPDSDVVRDLCTGIREELESRPGPQDIGLFLLAWQEVERILQSAATNRSGRVFNASRAAAMLEKEGVIDRRLAADLAGLREWRNRLVHGETHLSSWQLPSLLTDARRIAADLRRVLDQDEEQGPMTSFLP